MAAKNAIDKLKDGPKDDKVAVASGIAVSIVIVLLAAWAIFFFRRIQTGQQQLELGGGAQDAFNFTSVSEAQNQLKDIYNNVNRDQQDLEEIRNSNTSNQMQTQQQVNVQPGADTDQFTNTSN